MLPRLESKVNEITLMSKYW